METNVPRGNGKRQQPAAAEPPTVPRPRNPDGLRGAASPKGKPAGRLSEPNETEPEFHYTKLTYELPARQEQHSQPGGDAISGGQTLDLWMWKLSRRASWPIAVADPTHFIWNISGVSLFFP